MATLQALPDRQQVVPAFACYYAQLRAGQWPSRCQDSAFDAHVLACIIATALAEAAEQGLSISETTGLHPDQIASLFDRHFPLVSRSLIDFTLLESPHVEEEEGLLRQLLAEHRASTGQISHWLVQLIARRAMQADHLWQDLGLNNRGELNRLLARHFPLLHAGNTSNMKWKKYFYRKLCEAEGFSLCTAPSCSECDDFQVCFGTEDGLSQMARLRLELETAQ